MLTRAARIGVLIILAALMLISLGAAQPQQAPAGAARGNQPADAGAGARAGAGAARGNQAAEAGRGAGAGAGGFAFGNFDPASIQQMMDDNNRQMLGATPEEWKVLGPRFNKVQTLSRSLSGGVTGMFGMFGMGPGGMGGPGGRGGMGDAMTRGFGSILGEPTSLDKARDNLYAALENKSAPAELQAVIKTFREAKEKMRRELAAAQTDLRGICTVQQEATLIAMGLLD